MTALRASYSIAPEVLQKFNALVPSSERSKTVQLLMESILERREKTLRPSLTSLQRTPILHKPEQTVCCGTPHRLMAWQSKSHEH